MMQMKQVSKFLALIFIGSIFISCSSQNETPTNTSEIPDVQSSEMTETTSVENPTEDSSDSLDDVTAVVSEEPEDNEPLYTLDWKLDDDEIIAYKTAMEPTDGNHFSFNFDQFSGDAIPNEVRQQLSDIKMPETYSMISILEKNADENISVRLIFDEIDLPETEADDPIGASVNRMMGAMEGTVQLRGELTPEGAISSFYLEQTQRNLLAQFFELPTSPVHVGDSWEIDVNCISMGNGFIAADAERVNHIELTEITENDDGQPLAVIDYVIAETVEGDFLMPFSEELVPTTMSCTFLGQGLFLIEEGHWEQFTGEFAIKATGMMDSDAVQHFALTPLEDIPEQYIELR